MPSLDEVPTPALLLHLDPLEDNLRGMARRADRLGVRLRPHVKTHKCVEVARLQRDAGAAGITVSTLEEAEVFAGHGFEDMTWAFPVIPGRIGEAAQLDRRARLRLLVDHPDAAGRLEEAGHPFHVWLEVDCGDGRSGVDPEGPRLEELAGTLSASSTLTFDGLLTHSGQAYEVDAPGELAEVAERERAVMVRAAERLRDGGIRVPAVSVGSTPAASRARSLEGVDEIRPGNYALFDRTQAALGSCGIEDVAVSVLATVVSSRPERGQSVVDAGALALSSDPGPEDPSAPGGRCMGVLRAADGGLRDARLASLSQEHGLVDAALPYGERVRILPNHSCLTVACFDAFHAVRGGEVVDRWRIHRAR